ncbi:MAG: hypothetical protein QN229_06265 [Desulfurococcaceae archaeon TW002]
MYSRLIRFVVISFLTFLLIASQITYLQTQPQNTQDVTSDIISTLITNPKFYVSLFIQFILGLMLGYIFFKIIKYIIALIIVLAVGSYLSIWSLGDVLGDLLRKLFPEGVGSVLPYISRTLEILSLIIVGPVAVGFIVGILLALIKK